MIKRVACALSGGVDSAVSASILKRKGFDVIGVYMNNWDFVEEGETHCPRALDHADAQRICELLDIKFYCVNFVKEYWTNVFEGFLNAYRSGRTVVPDVQCNALIKFEALHQYAIESLGVDAIATGHYAQNSLGNFLEHANQNVIPQLLTAADPLKDQTYFLSRISEDQLRRSMFPIGELLKHKVKQVAVEIGLSKIAKKKESMGLCYVGKRRRFSDFLEKYIPIKEGPIVEVGTNCVVGIHSGIHHFTIGKRVALDTSHSTHYGFYVCRIDFLTNTVYLCRGSFNRLLFSKRIQLGTPHWINGPVERDLEFRCQRQHPTVKCSIQGDFLLAKTPIRAAAPGQTCVFYQGSICRGAAEIVDIAEPIR